MKEIEERPDLDDEQLSSLIDDIICEYSGRLYLPLAKKLEARRSIFSAIRGLDVIQDLIDDPGITEIMVNGENDVFIEKAGKLSRCETVFDSRQKLDDIVQRIAAGSNRVINEANPIVDARLPDGSRVNMILPPVALNGPIITIRKFSSKVISMDQLIELESISSEAAEFLKNLVVAGYNIFVSGGTGSGKTTFLNALSKFIPKDERIITIEDSAELQLKGLPNLVSLEVRNSNVEGRNSISVRDLIKTSLRMRPDRIIVGEVRDAACIDMLQAMNTGHSSMSTGHANSAADMLLRMETMTLLGTEIPLQAVKRQIASAVDIIIHLSRFRDGSRKVVQITEVSGFKDNEIVLKPLYEFEEEGEFEGKIKGSLRPTGAVLTKVEKLKNAGIGYDTGCLERSGCGDTLL